MITFITGLPGNGKTLFALWHIKMMAERANREVFYHNIKDLTLPWQAFDPEKWMDLPHGCVIVIDEAQFVFPKKPNGSVLPDFYEQLATHRHRGFDIFLITQHPSLVDNFVRRLVGQHFHVVRKFGLQRATVYEWSSTNPAPESAASQKNAIPLKWSYPKEVYGYYKSAEVHTVKRRIPAKIFLALAFVVAVLFAGWWALDRYQHRFDAHSHPERPVARGVVSGAAAGPPAAVPVVPGQASAATVPAFDPVADIRHYVAMSTPRVAGLPETAPKYDQLTQPRHVPVPAMCIAIGTLKDEGGPRCRCYSQQGTVLPDVPYNMCIQFSREGHFNEFDSEPAGSVSASAGKATVGATGTGAPMGAS